MLPVRRPLNDAPAALDCRLSASRPEDRVFVAPDCLADVDNFDTLGLAPANVGQGHAVPRQNPVSIVHACEGHASRWALRSPQWATG